MALVSRPHEGASPTRLTIPQAPKSVGGEGDGRRSSWVSFFPALATRGQFRVTYDRQSASFIKHSCFSSSSSLLPSPLSHVVFLYKKNSILLYRPMCEQDAHTYIRILSIMINVHTSVQAYIIIYNQGEGNYRGTR